MEDSSKSDDEYFDTKSTFSTESEEADKSQEENDEEFFDALGTQEEELPCKTSEKGTAPNEMSDTAYLDSVFGQLPPKSIIKTNLLFAKPACPQRRVRSKNFFKNRKTEA